MKFAVIGLGRMGKLVVRALFEQGLADQIAFFADNTGETEMHAHLLEFDTVHGRWDAGISATKDAITIAGRSIPFHVTQSIADMPLTDVDIVLDCTGYYKTEARIQPYFDAGVKKVVVSAPVKDGATANIVVGVNDEVYDPAQHNIITAASCTTNCIAPVIKVLLDNVGIEHGSFTTIHDVTNTQTIVDRPAKDWRRARSALNSLIPTTTGSAKAIMSIYPQLEGKLMGHAVRVPLLNASLTDLSLELSRDVTAEELNDLFAQAASDDLNGILGFETRPLVSCDFTNDTRSTIVDGPSTVVVNKRHAKIYAWYDNEYGYAWRLADVLAMVMAKQ